MKSAWLPTGQAGSMRDRSFVEAAPPVSLTAVKLTPTIAVAFVVQVVLLLVIAWRNLDLIESDGVAYTRLAQYYARGQFDLAVSGYWGPMLSWLIAPFLALGCDPSLSVRLAMASSALVFLTGSTLLLTRLGLPPIAVALGVWLCAAASVGWSVAQVTPDLLAAGWMAFALANQLPKDRATARHALSAGLGWGLTYLAKPVGLPLAVAVTLLLSAWLLFARASSRRTLAKRIGLTALAFLLVAGPWVAALSSKYDKFTFSESGRLAHSIVGPNDVERYHPIGRMLWRPDPGRITPWEDGSVMPYRHWSPFESAEYFRHQVRYSGGNVLRIWGHLSNFDWLSLGVVALMGAFLYLCNGGRTAMREDSWCRVLIPIGVVLALHVPVYADQTRYFYCLFPLLVAAVFGLRYRVLHGLPQRVLRPLFMLMLLISIATPAMLSIGRACVGLPNEAMEAARLVAERVVAAETAGRLAPVSSLVGYNGQAVGFLLERPWYGDLIHRNAQAYWQAEADMVLISRADRYVVANMKDDPRFLDLDQVLFHDAAEAGACVIKAFLRHSGPKGM